MDGILTRMKPVVRLLEVIRIAFQVVEFLLLIGTTLYNPVSERERERRRRLYHKEGEKNAAAIAVTAARLSPEDK